MTDATLPAARPRKILTQIAPVSWEHPADRAALQTLRSVPGFDEVVKKIVGLFVSQTPFVNAGAFGVERPFIVINSGALKLLDDDEMRTLLGHELGHIMSGHALYHTILVIIVFVGTNILPFLTSLVLAPIRYALLEWYGKSELSSDRAGLIATQDPPASMRMFLKMAGGGDMKQMDLNEFL